MSFPFESVEPTPEEIAGYQATLQEMFAQMDDMHRQMQQTKLRSTS